MTVRELLRQPDLFLGRRVSVEGSVHLGTFDGQKRVWVSGSISDQTVQIDPSQGILIRYPGIVGRFLPSRSGPIFPLMGFECDATLVHSGQQPWTYALVELMSARYFQRTGVLVFSPSGRNCEMTDPNRAAPLKLCQSHPNCQRG